MATFQKVKIKDHCETTPSEKIFAIEKIIQTSLFVILAKTGIYFSVFH